MDRQSARSIKLDGIINELVHTTNGLFCYTENTVHRIRTPEEIDPQNTNNDIPFENSLYRKSGTRNYITARTVIQSKRLLEAVSQKVDKQVIFTYLMNLETNLLLCNKIYRDIKDQVLRKTRHNVPVYKGVVDKLPVIDDLDTQVYQFLMSAKQVLWNVVRIFNEFHGTNFTNAHIDKIIDKMQLIGPENSRLLDNMVANKEFFKMVVDLRNAQEHADKKKYLRVDNFMLHSDGKCYSPSVKYFNGGLQGDYDVVLLFKSIINGLLNLAEVQMIYNILATGILSPGFCFKICRIPDSEIDEHCPVMWEGVFQRVEQTTVMK